MGHSIQRRPQKDRAALQKRHIGFVFQSYHLDTLTVYENIELPLSYRDVKKSEREPARRGESRDHPRGRADWQPALGPGARDHGIV
jgi:ABC-type lipoprotein export system ATPase subunit